jgi:hypothetical protein
MPSDQHEPVGQLAVASLLDMLEAKTGVQHAIEHVGERQVTETDAIGQTSNHGPRTAGAPPCLPVSRMDDAGAVGSWLLGERAGEARMQADVDEPTIRLQDAANRPCEGCEVVHVGVRERRHHQVEGAVREREPDNVTLNQGSHERPGPMPGDAELIGRRIDPHHRPSRGGEGSQMDASPAAHIQAAAGTCPHQVHEQRRGGSGRPGDVFVIQSAIPS